MLQERIQDRREHFTSHFTGHANDQSNGVPEFTPSASPDHTVETQFPKTTKPTLLAAPEFTPSTSPDHTVETQSSQPIQPTLLATPEITPSASPDHAVEAQFSKTIQPTLLPTPPEPWLWSPKSNENLVAQACACAAKKSVAQSPIIEAPQTQIPIHLPASTRLRNMINNSEKIIVCPGVYDGLSARIAISVGFDAMYMTGAGTTASRLGMADLGVAQLHDMRTNAEMIANLVPDGPPLIADMDTGYGGPLVIAKAVQQYILAGVAGFHIEDQVLQKRCGHLAGKEVVSAEEYLKRIQAAKGAAQRLRSDIVIIARTDALQSRGYDECVARLRMARDAGADMGILEGCTSKEQYAQAVQDLAGWPLCLNSVENGVSPVITADEAQAMGYRVMIFSFAGVFPAYTAIKATFEWLKAEGVTGTSSDVTPKTIFRVCGLSESMEIDKEAGGSAFANGV